MDDFERIRIVKKPKKKYKCNLCYCDITGEHYYVTFVQDGNFYAERYHRECHEAIDELCSDCSYNDDCTSSLEECFDDRIKRGIND